jgi:hypothetical protein
MLTVKIGTTVCVNTIQYKGPSGWGLCASGILQIPEERTPEVFIVLECDRSQKKETSVTLLWNPKTTHSTFLFGGYCTLYPKIWKSSNQESQDPYFPVLLVMLGPTYTLVSPHSTFTVGLQWFQCSIYTFLPRTVIVYVMLFCLLIFIIFIKIKLYVQAFCILHYLYILACNGWDQT